MNTFVNYLCNRPVQNIYHHIQHFSKKKYRRIGLILIVFLFLSLGELLGTALLSHGYIRMGDIMFHNERVLELLQEFKHGNFSLVNVYEGLPRGAAMNTFYPYLTLLPFVLLRAIIQNPITWLYTTLIMIAFLHYVLSFYSYKTYDNNDWHAFIFSILYSFGAVTFWWGYLAEDLGADLAIAFLPVTFFGFLRFIHKQRIWMLVLGFSLILYSHLITALLVSIMLIILYCCNFPELKTHLKTNILKAGQAIVSITLISFLLIMQILYVNDHNHISFPYSGNTIAFADGLLNYTPDFFGILIPVFVALIMCLQWHKSRLDKQLFYIGSFCVLINIRWIGKMFLALLPFARVLQFSIRFDIIANLAFSLIILDFCRTYSAPTTMLRKSIIRASILGLIFISVPCYEFTAPNALLQQPRFTAGNYHRFITDMARGHAKSIEYRINNHELQAMNGNTFYTDYMPQRSVNNWQADLSHHLASGNKAHRILIDSHVSSDVYGIHVTTTKTYYNVQIPIVLYHGYSYQLSMDSRLIPKRAISHRASNYYQVLVLKTLPQGTHTFNIQHVSEP